jgi:uncharacterized membrane protein
MFGLTLLGTFHTAISLIAVVAGFVALARDREISTRSAAGAVFFWGTVITCLTGFGIFQHGGFGKPHVLGIVTLIVLGSLWRPSAAAPSDGSRGTSQRSATRSAFSCTSFRQPSRR